MDVLRQNGIEAFLFDGESMEEELRRALTGVTHLVQSIAPGKADPLLRLLDKDGARLLPKLEWIAYLSTVGVYGDHKGAWVSEETPCLPVSGRSTERLEAEEGWLAMGREHGVLKRRCSAFPGSMGRDAMPSAIWKRARRDG